MPLPDTRCHVSFRRYSPLDLEVIEMTTKGIVFGPTNNFSEGRPRLFYEYGRLLARFTVHHRWVLFGDLHVRSTAVKYMYRMQNLLRRLGTNSGPILSHLWANVYETSRRCTRPIVVSNAPARLSISCFVLTIYVYTGAAPRFWKWGTNSASEANRKSFFDPDVLARGGTKTKYCLDS